MSPQVAGKQPVTALAGPYGHPLHPALVAIPIGAWIASLVFDIASLIVGNGTFLVRGALWLIAIGVLGALAAACFGFLDLFGIPGGTPAFRLGITHMSINLAVTLAFAGDWWWRFTQPENATAVAIGPFVLSIIAIIALTVSGYLGGKLAYRYGIRVAAEETQAEGFTTSSSPSHHAPVPGAPAHKES